MKLTNKANRLITEKSPYLLQHAYNLVNWYPWSQEAFDKARQEDKPIFLSIGYSTCHWCHVMERESFEDEEVAELLNSHFISIKVDREERPDVDNIYMSFCQAFTGQGGWPTSIFMNSEARPFFAGTYFPKVDNYGRIGLTTLLERIAELWKNERQKLIEEGESITNSLKEHEGKNLKAELAEDIIHSTFEYLDEAFEPRYGGFSTAPKFPTPHNLLFLLRYWYLYRNENALKMVTTTLNGMYQGGIFDHIGLGFSRYSTDGKWLVPHFEKMLYDNALLTMAYLETYQATRNEQYAIVAKKTLEYVRREMTSNEGGFYTAEDADSEGEEGKFYVWKVEEIADILGEEDGAKFCNIYDITKKGNFEGVNIPNLINQPKNHRQSAEDIAFIESSRKKLFEYRENRVHPYKDDKILVSWNGLMIGAFAMGSRILKSDEYSQVASKAVEFVYDKMFNDEGRLLSRYRHGDAAIPGFIDDYAFLAWGLIELFETTSKTIYLKRALELATDMIEFFWDKENSGLFLYGNDAETLIMRPKESYDGAIPSGNSVAAMVFFKLSRLTGDSFWEEKLNNLLTAFGETLSNNPAAHTFFMMSYLSLIGKAREIILVGKDNMKGFQSMIDVLKEEFRPFDQHIIYNIDEDLTDVIGFLDNYSIVDNKATAYVCSNYACQKPVTDMQIFEELIVESRHHN